MTYYERPDYDPTDPSDDVEFVLGRQSYSLKKGEKLTRANYITVDFLHTGQRELSFVIAIAEEITPRTYDANAMIIDITTAAQRRAFTDQRNDFSKKLGLENVTSSTEFGINEMPALSKIVGQHINCVIDLETMYRIILDLRLHERFHKAADDIEKMLSKYIRFEVTDAPAAAPIPKSPEPSVYHKRYEGWGSW